MGQIEYFDDQLQMVGDSRAKIVQIQTKPTGHTPILRDGSCYKEITAGLLRLQGKWCPCSRWPKFEEKYYKSHIIDTGGDLEWGFMFRYFDYGIEERYLERHKNRRSLSLLEIAIWDQNTGEPDFPSVHFLILESGNDEDESFFRRVGIVVVQNAHLEDFER